MEEKQSSTHYVPVKYSYSLKCICMVSQSKYTPSHFSKHFSISSQGTIL